MINILKKNLNKQLFYIWRKCFTKTFKYWVTNQYFFYIEKDRKTIKYFLFYKILSILK